VHPAGSGGWTIVASAGKLGPGDWGMAFDSAYCVGSQAITHGEGSGGPPSAWPRKVSPSSLGPDSTVPDPVNDPQRSTARLTLHLRRSPSGTDGVRSAGHEHAGSGAGGASDAGLVVASVVEAWAVASARGVLASDVGVDASGVGVDGAAALLQAAQVKTRGRKRKRMRGG
jgi:hypothetical protein